MEYNIITLLLIHFFADFIFQTRTMAKNKSKSIYWLTLHVLSYTAVTLFGWVLFLNFISISFNVALMFIIVTFATHWIIDFITSRANSYCYLKMEEKEGNAEFWEYAFWILIGLDQMIHGITLILTYKFLYIQ